MSGTPTYFQYVGYSSSCPCSGMLVDLQHRVLINCGESFQRLATEHRLRISKLTDVIITKCDPMHMGGLVGLLLTLDGVESPTFDYPYQRLAMDQFWRSQDADLGDAYLVHWRSFAGLPPNFREYRELVKHTRFLRVWGPAGMFADLQPQLALTAWLGNIAVEFVEPADPATPSLPLIANPLAAWDPHLTLHLRGDTITHITGQGKVIYGKFQVQKAKALNIPPGKLYAALKKGESVTLENGTVIESSQVCDLPTPGVRYAIVTDRVPEPLDAQLVIDISNSNGESEQPNTVEFKASDVQFYPYVAQQVFNELLGTLVPMLYTNASASHTWRRTDIGARVPLVPPGATKFANEPPVDVPKLVALKKKELMAQIPAALIGKGQDGAATLPDIVLLGTGAAAPSKYRNVSATWLRVAEDFSLLFDCGEGTLAQIAAAVPPAELDAALLSIRCVVISHKHGDHINGLPLLLQAIHQRKADQRLWLVLPSDVAEWVNHLGAIDQVTIKTCNQLMNNPLIDNAPVCVIHRDDDCLVQCSVTACPVDHINGELSFGFRVIVEERWLDERKRRRKEAPLKVDVSFSGDMRPTPAFDELIRGTDVLIHEATFEDDLIAEARARRHSTTGQCLEAATKSGCRILVMTHFSQRYPSVPSALTKLQKGFLVALGVDFLRIPLSADRERLQEALDINQAIIGSLQQSLADTDAAT